MATADQPKTVGSAVRSFSVLALLYTVLVFLLPANTASMRMYHLSPVAYHILLFVVVLPSLVVWYTAFYGSAKLQHYAQSISKAPEAAEFHRLARGMAWLAWSLPVPAIISLVLDSIADSHSGFHGASIILINYASLILPLVGFSVIATGARGLTARSTARTTIASARGILLLLIALGVVYCFLVFRQFSLTKLGSAQNPYHLPIWLMITTQIIPYLYAWFIGLLAAYEINGFGKHVRGLLYRQPLQLVAGGLTLAIIGFIALQYSTAVAAPLGHLLFNYHLVAIYVFRIIVATGFLLIAYGVNRLKKIEEI